MPRFAGSYRLDPPDGVPSIHNTPSSQSRGLGACIPSEVQWWDPEQTPAVPNPRRQLTQPTSPPSSYSSLRHVGRSIRSRLFWAPRRDGQTGTRHRTLASPATIRRSMLYTETTAAEGVPGPVFRRLSVYWVAFDADNHRERDEGRKFLQPAAANDLRSRRADLQASVGVGRRAGGRWSASQSSGRR